MKQLWSKIVAFVKANKVVVIGTASASLLALSELLKGGYASIPVLVVSVLIAGASYMARNIAGKLRSMLGLIVNAGGTFLQMQTSGHVDYRMLLIQFALMYLAILSGSGSSATAPIEEKKP